MYEKTLKLPSWLLNEGDMSTGQVMNHMNVDPLNVCFFFYMCHLTWSILVEVSFETFQSVEKGNRHVADG